MIGKLARLLEIYKCEVYLCSCGHTITYENMIYADNIRLKSIIRHLYEYKRGLGAIDFSKSLMEARACFYIKTPYTMNFGYIVDRKQWWHPFNIEIFNESIEKINKISNLNCLIESNEYSLPFYPKIKYIHSNEVDKLIAEL